MKNQIISHYPFSGMIPYSPSESNVMTDIVETVCREYKIQPGEVYGPSKELAISECRQACMYFLKVAGHSLSAIGRLLSRTHTAVWRGLQEYNDYLETSPRINKMNETLSLVL